MGETPIDIEALTGWIGRTETVSDTVTPRLHAGLRATFEPERHFPSRADLVAVTAHWCLAPPAAPMSTLGPDGHPARGGFLPPVPLPRRMWAGGELEILDALQVGDEVSRTSRVADVTLKHGRTGPLCFVTVTHEIETPRGLAVRERQDIVYREAEAGPAPAAKAAAPAPVPEAEHSLTLTADPVLLFRYSALTFNGHRIHYDRPYAMNEEHYPGLVVHGPLQAGLLAEFAAHLAGGAAPRRFAFRGARPLFDGAPFTLNARRDGEALALWAADAGGAPTMTAQAGW